MNFPSNVKYTEEHEWVSVDGGIATIGITDFAQGELGDIVYLDILIPSGGITKGLTIASIEAVKTVSDIFSPCGGNILEFNHEIEAHPEVINSDPYGLGWIAKIELTNPDELSSLMDSEQYKKHIGQ